MSEKSKSFDDFLAGVPDAPSSAAPVPEAPAEAPKTDPVGSSTETQATQLKDEALSSDSPPDSASGAESSAKSGERASVDDILQALKAGDLEKLSELVGEDPELHNEKSRRWAARKRKEEKLQRERDEVHAKAETIVQRWAPVNDLAERVANDDYAALPELVRVLTGKDWDSAAMKAFRAIKAQDPAAPVLRERVAKAEKERDEALAMRAETALAAVVRDEVPARDPVRRIEGWETKVAKALRDEYDPDLGEPRISAKQAAARVVREEREAYERLSKVFAEPVPAPPAPRAPERAAGATGVGKRKLTREEWLAAHANG